MLITFVGPAASEVVKLFQPADYFALMVLAFTSVGALVGRSALRGMISLGLGLFVGLIGFDEINGQARYVFGQSHLQGGISVVLLAVGLFAVGETLYVASHHDTDADEIVPVRGKLWLSRGDFQRSWKPWLRGTALGLSARDAADRWRRGPDVPVVRPGEDACRSTRTSSVGARSRGSPDRRRRTTRRSAACSIPLLTLALPTSATAAIMLTAFQQYGIQPGPSLFTEQAPLLWALIASMYIGNVMLVVLNLPLVRLWVKLLEVPKPVLYSAILVFACLGVFSASRSTYDMYLMIGDRRARLPHAGVGHPGRADDRRAHARPGDGGAVEPGIEHQPRRPERARHPSGERRDPLASPCSRSRAPHVPRLVRVLRGQAAGSRLILGDADAD